MSSKQDAEFLSKYVKPLVCSGNNPKRAENTQVKMNEAEIFPNARRSAMSLMLIRIFRSW
jgi:hypothetical protein